MDDKVSKVRVINDRKWQKAMILTSGRNKEEENIKYLISLGLTETLTTTIPDKHNQTLQTTCLSRTIQGNHFWQVKLDVLLFFKQRKFHFICPGSLCFQWTIFLLFLVLYVLYSYFHKYYFQTRIYSIDIVTLYGDCQ